MSVREVRDGSSILDAPGVVVVPVNCVAGVMGAGLALAAARRWPALRVAHREACLRDPGGLRPGGWVPARVVGPPPRWVALVATKDHWRDRSRVDWVRDGLGSLGAALRRSPPPAGTVVALPRLGCGLGGLAWADIEPSVMALCRALPEVAWWLYPDHPLDPRVCPGV